MSATPPNSPRKATFPVSTSPGIKVPPGTNSPATLKYVKGLGLYLRKSTDRQELSLPAQESLIREFIVREQITLPTVAVYRDILSGARPDRRGYQQMLADARAGKLHMIIFHKINRFGRNAAEGLAAIEELRRLGVVVRIVDLPALDISKPEGMLIFSILLSQGQYEIENLGNEARKGMEFKASQGGWPFRAPDGYRNVRVEVAPRKFRSWIEPDRPRAAIVRLIFRWYASGQVSLQDIVRRLNQLHSQRNANGKRGCLRRSGKPWDIQAVHRMLTNRFYIGEIAIPAWQIERSGTHRSLINMDTYQTVQAYLRQNGQLHNGRHDYLLQDLLTLNTTPPIALYCTVVRHQGRAYRYYYHYAGDQRIYYPADPIDQQVVDRLREQIVRLGDNPIEAARRQLAGREAELRRHAQARLDKLHVARQQLLRLATGGFFTEAEIATQQGQLETEERWAHAELARAESLASMCNPQIDEALADLTALCRWEDLNIEEQHAIVGRLLQQVWMNVAGGIERLEWRPLWDMLWFGPAPLA